MEKAYNPNLKRKRQEQDNNEPQIFAASQIGEECKLTRRHFLELAAASSAAATLTGCGSPEVGRDALATEIAAEIFATQTAEQPASSTPTSTPVSTSTHTPTPTLTPDDIVTPVPATPKKPLFGQIQIEYPSRISSSSTEIITASIRILNTSPAVEPTEATRTDSSDISGETQKSAWATIDVEDIVLVELSGDDFEIESTSESKKKITINKPTIWTWRVTAPSQSRGYEIAVQVFLGEENQASWSRTYRIEVVEPTPTPIAPPPAAGHYWYPN